MATLKEREEKLIKKMEKLKQELSEVKKRNSAQERKARTKRLIELGANIESKLSPEAVLVFRYLPKDKFKPVEKWLLEHKDEAEKIKAEEEAKKQEKQKAKEKKKAPAFDMEDEEDDFPDFSQNSPGSF